MRLSLKERENGLKVVFQPIFLRKIEYESPKTGKFKKVSGSFKFEKYCFGTCFFVLNSLE